MQAFERDFAGRPQELSDEKDGIDSSQGDQEKADGRQQFKFPGGGYFSRIPPRTVWKESSPTVRAPAFVKPKDRADQREDSVLHWSGGRARGGQSLGQLHVEETRTSGIPVRASGMSGQRSLRGGDQSVRSQEQRDGGDKDHKVQEGTHAVGSQLN